MKKYIYINKKQSAQASLIHRDIGQLIFRQLHSTFLQSYHFIVSAIICATGKDLSQEAEHTEIRLHDHIVHLIKIIKLLKWGQICAEMNFGLRMYLNLLN